MPGPVSSVRANVNHIRNLLEQYECEADGFTVWKELIQNANDAEAAVLSIGWCRGLKTACHPLLKVPALFVVNSGEFKPEDADKLLTIGDTSKSADTAKIGRFGLGMKSLFHWCEAFIFIASDSARDAKWGSRNNVFSPWFCPAGSKETSRHADWDRFEPADKALIEDELRDVIADLHSEETEKHWFCVWIPLRNESQLCGRSPIPREAQFSFNCEDDIRRLFAPELAMRIGETPPLLDRLERICLWSPMSGRERIQKNGEIKCVSNTRRPSLSDKTSFAKGSTTCSGAVSSSAAPTWLVRFVRHDCLLPQRELMELQKQNGWPRVPGGTDEFDQDIPEKAEPHAAVRVMEVPLREGHRARLVLQWAVFLPLGDKVEQLLELLTWKKSVSILLHGYFFTDAGRRLVKPGSNNGPIADWNQRLQNDGTLPLLLLALVDFVHQVGASDREIHELVGALEQSEFIKERLPAICRDREWLFAVEACEAAPGWRGAWKLLPKNSTFRTIPEMPKEVSPHDLLPRLLDSTPRQVITFEKCPRIATAGVTPWSSTELRKVVSTLVPSVLFKSNEHLEYFAQFLEHCANSEDQKLAVGEALWPLLKKAFQDDSLTLKRIEELGATLCRVLEYVPEEHRLVLNWASNERRGADEAFRLIAKDESDLLPIPSSLRPATGSDCKTIARGIVVRVLRSLNNVSLDSTLLADVVGDLLKRADLDRETLWQSLNDVQLLVIYDCGQKQTMRRTWLELSEHKRRRLVFCDQAGLTQQLQAALGDAGSVWRIDPDFAKKVLGDNHGLPDCSVRECAVALAPPKYGNAVHFGGAALGAWEPRRELLKELANTIGTGASDDQERLKDACRLLIHGRSQDANFNAALFLAADGQCDALAENLVQHVLAKRQEEWRILSGEAAVWAMDEGLTATRRKSLDLFPLRLDEPQVFDLLLRASDEQLKDLAVNQDDYARLIETLDDSRDDLLKRLPIHLVANSRARVSIPDDLGKVFWDGGYKLAPELTGDILLLALDRRPKVAERQKKLAPLLDRVAAMRLVLESEQSHEHWAAILRAIEQSDESLPDDVVEALKTKAWLPSRFGAKGGNDLICLTLTGQSKPSQLPEEFKQEVTRLVEANNGARIADWLLDEKLLKELTRESRTVCQLLVESGVFPNETESLQRLGDLLGKEEQHHIGHVPFDLFQDWLGVEWDSAVMPCHQLLRVMRECFGAERTFDPGAAKVREPIADFERVVGILNSLGKQHNQARTRDSKDRTVRVFRRYLEFLLKHQEFESTSQLAPVQFLSRAGTWESPAELCLPTDGIAPKHILSGDLAELLEPWCGQASKASVPSCAHPLPPASSFEQLAATSQSSALLLENYFRPWESHVPHDVIGGFVSLLGGNPAIEQLASRYLGKRSLDETRRNLRVSPSPFGKRHIRMADVTFDISIVHGDTELMTNLMGQQFRAALTNGNDCILVGWGDGRNFDVYQNGSQWRIGIRLRAVDFSATNNSSNAAQLLSHAAALLLDEVFAIQQHSIPDLVNETFADLQASDQLEIRVTQQLILEDAELLLSQLGLHADELLGPVISNQTRFRRLRAERSHNQERFGRAASWTEDEIDDEQTGANRNLRRLLEDESSGGPARVLRAVCQRIQGHNQYNSAAVPFELFQNADDAAVERTQWLRSSLSAISIDYFIGPNTLTVRHFGRCVNQVPPDCDPRDDKLADDLRKMLTLWLSNKDAPSGDQKSVELTGKFGLGFKSVFLVSDKPQLLSGRIGCEIVGGVFPRYLDLEQRRRFDRFIHDLTDERKREVTVIELPLRNEVIESGVGAIVSRFREMAHLLVVFARQIRSIQLNDDETGKKYETSWQEQSIPGLPNCFKGSLRPLPVLPIESAPSEASGKDIASPHRALVLRASKHSDALLLVHDGRQFKRLAKEVPTLWVTAPTRQELDVGFALNARFSLDPGRAQLGTESPENDEIATDLGRELGQRFVALFEHSRKVGWPRFCQDIGLDNHASEYDFWDSLWELLGPGLSRLDEKSNAAKLLLQVFWQSDWSAARYFYSSCRALPNGLDSEFARLTAIRDVRYELRGLVADIRVLERFATWAAWAQMKMAPASCLGRERVVIPLEKIGRLLGNTTDIAELKREVVKLEDVLRCEIAIGSPMSSETATRLSEVLFSEPCVSKEFDEAGEWKQIVPILEAVALPDRTGKPQPAKQLLFGALPENLSDEALADEVKLAGFAPSDRVLYRQFLIGESVRPVVSLIRKCRGHHQLKAQEIAGWAIRASGAEAKNAVKHYLAQGRRRDEVIEALRSRDSELRCSWLAGLVGTDVLQTAGEREQGIVDRIGDYETSGARLAQSDDILRKVLDWWKSPERPLLDPRRYRLFDPTQHGPLRIEFDRDDIAQRKAWMRLFLLGISHTTGRTSASQDAGFICDFCEARGWLDVFVEPDGDPNRWIRLLRDYLEAQIDTSQYLHWMRQFVAIFAMAERLDDYVASFLSIEGKSSQFGLTAITCPGTSNEAPVDAPPIARILGMGACFIVRELLRLKVLTNQLAWEHAFVPKGEVRQLLEVLGCTFESNSEGPWMRSREIWSFLKEKSSSENDAIFELSFDLPFQMLAHKDNSEKRLELLSVDWQYDEADDQQD